MSEAFHYSMKIAAKRTGLTPHVIRAWERRYRAVQPRRTDTNRRLYSEQDIERLLLLRCATDAGHAIGRVANLPSDDLRALIQREQGGGEPVVASNPEAVLEECLIAVRALDARKLELLLGRAGMTVSQPDLVERIIAPLMYCIGELWTDGELRVVHEHMATSIVRTLLGNLKDAFNTQDSAPCMVATTLPGQAHELGALLATVTAASEGWRVLYLGAELPADQIAAAVRQADASVLALSLVYPPDDPQVDREIRQLSRFLPGATRVIVGGRSAFNYNSAIEAIGAVQVTDLSGFRTQLRTLRGS